jgi:Subtilisin inhibitor-like
VRLLLVALALVVVFVPAAASAPATAQTRLSIAVWPRGAGAGKPVRVVTLTCSPAGGTHPAPARACARLYANLGALRAVRLAARCSARSTGPQRALVRGKVRGRRVRAVFTRSNSCQIARWNRLRVLFTARAKPPAPTTSLDITVWPEGTRAASFRRTLTCDPPGGTHPHPARACKALLAARAPFAANQSERPCTLIWGGPQVARVEGRFRGEPVHASFDRTDGCEIARWDRVAFLFVH